MTLPLFYGNLHDELLDEAEAAAATKEAVAAEAAETAVVAVVAVVVCYLLTLRKWLFDGL